MPRSEAVHAAGVSFGHGWARGTALAPCCSQVAVENGVRRGRSRLLNALLHTSVSCYLPFGFQYAALATATKKNQQKSHPKLPGVRWSSNWRSVQKDLWTRASSEQTFPICFFLFFAPKSTLQLCPRQALGPKTVKCQKMEKKKKRKIRLP